MKSYGCPKCGSWDIGMRYHRDEFDCAYRERSASGHPPRTEEHLHRTCRSCGFSWRDRVLNADPKAEALPGEYPQ